MEDCLARGSLFRGRLRSPGCTQMLQLISRCADLGANVVHNSERGAVLQNIRNVFGGQQLLRDNIYFECHLFGQRSGVTAVSSGSVLSRFSLAIEWRMYISPSSKCWVFFLVSSMVSVCSLVAVSRDVFRRNVARLTPAQLQLLRT